MDTVGTEIVLQKIYKHRQYIVGLCCKPWRKTNKTVLGDNVSPAGPTALEEEHHGAQSHKGSI